MQNDLDSELERLDNLAFHFCRDDSLGAYEKAIVETLSIGYRNVVSKLLAENNQMDEELCRFIK